METPEFQPESSRLQKNTQEEDLISKQNILGNLEISESAFESSTSETSLSSSQNENTIEDNDGKKDDTYGKENKDEEDSEAERTEEKKPSPEEEKKESPIGKKLRDIAAGLLGVSEDEIREETLKIISEPIERITKDGDLIEFKGYCRLLPYQEGEITLKPNDKHKIQTQEGEVEIIYRGLDLEGNPIFEKTESSEPTPESSLEPVLKPTPEPIIPETQEEAQETEEELKKEEGWIYNPKETSENKEYPLNPLENAIVKVKKEPYKEIEPGAIVYEKFKNQKGEEEIMAKQYLGTSTNEQGETILVFRLLPEFKTENNLPKDTTSLLKEAFEKIVSS